MAGQGVSLDAFLMGHLKEPNSAAGYLREALTDDGEADCRRLKAASLAAIARAHGVTGELAALLSSDD